MNKRMMLAALLLVSVAVVLRKESQKKSGTGTILTRLFTGKTGTS